MPQIPTPSVSARSTRVAGVGLDQNVNPDAFGAQIGAATRHLGGAAEQLGVGLQAEFNRKQQEELANAVAQSGFTPIEVQTRQEVGENAAGYRDTILSRYDEFVETEANKIEDDRTRMEYRKAMYERKANVSSRAALYEEGQATESSKIQADASLQALQNKITSDPTQYEDFVKQGEAVIAARPDMTALQEQAMKVQWRRNSAYGRFEGMLGAASSVQDVDNIAAELAGETEGGPDWTKEFGADDYARMLDKIGTVRKAIVTKADTDARAALDTLDGRNNDLATIPREELNAASQLVRQSENPVTQARFARIARDQELIKQYRGPTPEQLRIEINAANVNPGAAYPGMPPRVSTAINRAASQFDVSASYLGATVTREYGGQLQYDKRGDPKFEPFATSNPEGVSALQPEVMEALTVAGEAYGKPLQIGVDKSSAPGSVRVSTIGLSDADQGKLAGSLVDAGFTGIQQYDGYLTVDMRDAIPSSYGDKDGKTWGGWTYLSPGVAGALTERGFAPGVKASDIKRAAPPSNANQIDYGVKAETSSATGVMQFLDDTWLELMKDGVTAKRIGVDITGMSDAQILAMRANPDIAIPAGAAFAEKNKYALEQSLGRSVSDPELYMAHFLGAGGANVLITAYDNNPNASAAAMMPKQAEANHNVFYNKDGSAKTVSQVYNDIARSFVSDPSQVRYGDNQTRQNIIDNTEKALKDDPMSFARDNGKFDVQPLSDNASFIARGQAARSAAEYYNIPMSDFKPLTVDEVSSITSAMDSGDADAVLNSLAQIQQMGGDVARAAFKQIGEKDKTYEYAAGLAYEGGAPTAAGDVIRGRKRLNENEAIKTGVGTPDEISNMFSTITSGSLMEVAPSERQAIQDAAFAHYIETYTARGGTGLNKDAFERSVQAVLGGGPNAPAVATVNGQPTVLPKGVSGEDMNTAIDRMTIDDWTRQSVSKLPPRYVNGEIASPGELAYEGVLRSVGGGVYKVMMDDGTFLVDGTGSGNGRFNAFLFKPDPKVIGEVVNRPAPDGPPVRPYSQEQKDDYVRYLEGAGVQGGLEGQWDTLERYLKGNGASADAIASARARFEAKWGL